MEVAAMDCYEDMFKEITRKLYGEEVEAAEYDDLAAALAGASAAAGAADRWVQSEEALPWTASKVAAYNPAQKLFRCCECDCVGFLGRVAEHWLAAHGHLRAFRCPRCPYSSAWARCVRVHVARTHGGADAGGAAGATDGGGEALDELSRYLQRLKARAEAARAPPPAPPPPHAGKRYCCGYCPYATDRRDLFTRHENIHREEKPFQCYVCHKQFNRADHVKKHFLRMHRDFPYDLNRIRRQPAARAPAPLPPPPPAPPYLPRGPAAGGGKARRKGEKRYSCCYCPWSGVDNWCLKRHLNTHLKPFQCALCDYKAARAERLATHVLKVHNKRACGRCAFLGDDAAHLAAHVQDHHPWEHRNGGGFAAHAGDGAAFGAPVKSEPAKRQHCGAERLFHYMEASDEEEETAEEDGAAPPPLHACRDCGCEFLDAASLETHAMTHRAGVPAPPPARPLPYRCSVCGGGRASQAAMLEHMRSHAGVLLRCRADGCGFATACGRDALRDHASATHDATAPKRARKQRRPRRAAPDASEIRVLQRRRGRTPAPAALRRLRQLLSRRRRWCWLCPRRGAAAPYHTAASLALHRRWRHAAPRFLCEHCPRVFRHRYQVVLHASREHVGFRAAAPPPSILNVPRIASS